MTKLALLLLSLLCTTALVCAQDLPSGEVRRAAEDTAQEPASDVTVDDRQIAERLRRIFARVDDLASVEVEVAAGVVELRGDVVAEDSREKAETLAQSIDGVVFVSNRIRETTELTKRIMPNVDRLAGYAQDAVLTLPLLAVALLVLVLFWWLGRRLGRTERLFERLTDKKLIQGILSQVAKTLVLLVGLFLALEIVGATALVGAVLGTAGVVGLAIGFAFRDIVENYLASIILSIRQPFRSKDLIEVDGKLGTVIRMTTRETVMMTPEGNHLSLPNAAVFKSTIVNYTRAPLRRFDVAVGVGTDVDLKQACELGVRVLEQMAGVVDDPAPFARVETLGDSTVTVRFCGWVDQRQADFGKVRSEAVRLIKLVLDESGVDMPAPTYRVEMERAADEAAPRRSASPADVRAEAAAVDVEPERHIEEQVDADILNSDEPDLLESDPDAEQPAAAR